MSTQGPTIESIYQNKQLGSPLFQAALVFGFIILFSIFVIRPKYESVNELKEQANSVQSQRQTLEEEQQALNMLVAKLEASPEQIKLLDEALPLDSRPTSTSVMIESYAGSSGLQLAQIGMDALDKEISTGNKAVIEDPYSVSRQLVTSNITVVVSGSVDQFRNFLQLLETSGRIIDVSELQITNGQDTITFKLQLKAYEYGEKTIDPNNP